MYGKYIYGIIIGDGNTNLGVRGVGSAGLVYTIAHQGLSCVVSDYSGKDFSAMSKEELVRCLLAHQAVVERVMKRHTVLPVKFGTVLLTSDEVCDLISQGHSQFFLTLLWMQDKVEVEVVATWDREQASMVQRRDSYLERIINFLKPVSIEVQPNALGSGEMVMSVAFLLEGANLGAFDSRVRQLNDLFYNQINLHIIGPLPPYSFATVEVTKLSPEKMEEARQSLGLGEVISELEVRKAYRHLAVETHSDRRPGGKLARTQFAQLRRASDLLIAYCRGQAESGGSFLISIRRSRSDEVQPPRLVEIGA
jgi:hypothetical protein